MLLDIRDAQGNSALHLASMHTDEAVSGTFTQMLLNHGCDATLKNKTAKTAREICYPKSIHFFEAMDKDILDDSKFRHEYMPFIRKQLPANIELLQDLAVELCISHHIFAALTKKALFKCLEEKHAAMLKSKVLEQAAGVDDTQGDFFFSQLERLQAKDEESQAEISFQKLRIKSLQTSLEESEALHASAIEALEEEHDEESDRAEIQIVGLENEIQVQSC